MAFPLTGAELPKIPDTALVAEATELVREAATPLIYHHSRRVFFFGALRGQRQGVRFDPELLYVGAMFHDLGLTQRYRRADQRFEIDGADEARRFLRTHAIDEQAAQLVWTGIALLAAGQIHGGVAQGIGPGALRGCAL